MITVESKPKVIECPWLLNKWSVGKTQSFKASNLELVYSDQGQGAASPGICTTVCTWRHGSPLSLVGGPVVAPIPLSIPPASSTMRTSSSKEVGELEPEPTRQAWETFTAAPTRVPSTFSFPSCDPAHLGTPLDKVAKHQHKENQWQMDWNLIFASSHYGIMQPLFECFASPRLMRSPWEFVNRRRRWNCHISLAPLFWLSSEITQCGFSSAQGNHEFSTHYTYPLHLFYHAPYSKWHLIVLGKYLFLCKLP